MEEEKIQAIAYEAIQDDLRNERKWKTSREADNTREQDPPIRSIKVHDVATWIHEELPHKEQIIEGGILPQQAIALIGGIAKLGKSMFALNMAIQIATGKPFLDEFNIPEPKRVLYIQAEVSEQEIQNRLNTMIDAIGDDLPEDRLFLINERGLKLDRLDDFEFIRDQIKEHGADVLVIDPLYKFHSREENSTKEMTALLDRVDSLVQEQSISVVIIHHFGKPNEQRSGLTKFRGSSTIIDYADSYMMLTRKHKEDEPYFTLSFELRNAEKPQPMTLHRNPETLWYEVKEMEEQSKVTVNDVVLALHALGGKTKKKDSIVNMLIAEKDASARYIHDFLKQAIAEGKILTADLYGPGNPKYYYVPEKADEIKREMRDEPRLFKWKQRV